MNQLIQSDPAVVPEAAPTMAVSVGGRVGDVPFRERDASLGRARAEFPKGDAMLTTFWTSLTFLRARWRWIRGRCPRCNRDLYDTPTRRAASEPNCPVCKDETQTDLRVWHAYSRFGPAPAPVAPA